MNRMTRFISLLLAAALLYLGAGGALAETATEPALNFKVLPGLMEGQQANPAERNIFEKPEEVAVYCEKIYGYIDPELVGNFFYGGPEEMTDLMKQLYKAIVGVDDIFIDRGLDLCSTFYAYVWEILHMEELPAQAKSRPAVKETMKAVFSEFPAEDVPVAADICIDYIVQYEPEIEDAAYSQYGDGIRTVEGDEEYRKYFQEGFALFDEGRVLQFEALTLLESDILHGDVRHVIEVVMTEFLELHLDVGLDDAMVAGFPLAFTIAARHIGEVQEIVRVVDQRGIERGGVQVLDFAGLIAQHDVEHLALGSLLDGQGYLRLHFGSGGRLIGLHLTGADVERTFIGRRLGACLAHNDQVAFQRGALKAVLVFNIDILAVDSCHSAASHVIEEAHDIVNLYFHDDFVV